ncbi:MAG: N-6 DNA methylase [Porticoccaceae bacterium]
MLDTATKRRIDTARDILVGKVPDPKSQVEQITIALIYKFMDDMDAEAEELGGHRKFFAGDQARYGWAKLMRSGLGGHETLNLYAEAIARMPENPGIPPLFRDIFKNAYLPYRDPETLRAFLKIIDEFEYDHSERLGDAFEYLLSVLGSQGDAGQFRTPRHIIDFIVAVLDPQKHETVLDPACGTAGFLISAWKHILKHNSSPRPLAGDDCMDAGGRAMPRVIAEGRGDPGRSRSGAGGSPSPLAGEGRGEGAEERAGDLLTPDERGRLARNFKGYDISPDMVRLSLVNLYLHGFTDPHIFEYDTLTSQERWHETADVILANPPFMSPKGGIRPHNRFSVQSKRSEVLFVDYMAEHLTPNGRAGIIVPEGIIFQSQGAYRQLRKLLVEDYLIAVVSLPAGVFQPYSGVKTSILILDKALARSSDSIAFVKVQNDGFGLGAQRRAIDKNDLPAATTALQAFRHSRPRSESRAGANGNPGDTALQPLRHSRPRSESRAGAGGNPGAAALHVFRHSRAGGNPVDFDPSQYPGLLVVEKSRIAANGDYNLSGERYREGIMQSTPFPWRTVESLVETITPPSKIQKTAFGDTGRFPIIDQSQDAIAGWTDDESALVRPSKPLVIFGDHTCAVKLVETPFAQGADGIKILQAIDILDPRFLFHVLRARPLESKGYQRHYSKLKEHQIPLPPLEIQKEIVAEIEGYQKVIDGARAVLDHYRPHIPIHPDWPMVHVGEVGSFASGGTPSKANESYWTGAIPWVSAKDLKVEQISDAAMHISDAAIAESATQIAPVGSLLILVRGMGLANGVPICEVMKPCAFNQDLKALLPNPEAIHGRFLAFALRQQDTQFRNVLETAAHGTLKLNSDDLRQIQIPLPPLATQQAIVAEIEAEQALVNANRELIARFEQKIQATLARVWGEEGESANAGDCAATGDACSMPDLPVTPAVSPQLV